MIVHRRKMVRQSDRSLQSRSETIFAEAIFRFCAAIILLFNVLELTIRARARAMKLLEIKRISNPGGGYDEAIFPKQ